MCYQSVKVTTHSRDMDYVVMKLLNRCELLQPSNQLFISFLKTLLWAECNDNGEPLDDALSFDDIDQTSADMIKTICDEFIAKAGNDAILEHDYSQAGHDLYLTIAGHGSGFWDGDWPVNGENLTILCDEWIKDITVSLGDDNLVYIDTVRH
jgi:hypothetical protein